MIFTISTNSRNNETIAKTFYTWNEYNVFFFSPCMTQELIIDTDTAPAGKTYHDKKKWLQNKAIALSGYDYDISWLELSNLQDYFLQYGKKYGLLKEFRENAIC